MDSLTIERFKMLGLYPPKPTRLLGIIDRALDNNPYQKPAMATPPTVAVSATSDATLTVYPLVNGTALHDNASRVAFYGGYPVIIASAYVAMAVANVAPSTAGNIGGGAVAGLNQWASAIEFMTDSDKVQIGLYTTSSVKHMFQVDGQYVDFAGSAGLATTGTDCFFLLTFASRKPRRIRVLIPSLPSKGPTMIKTIRLSPTCSMWKPNQANVLRLAWYGDSYSEGTNGSSTIYPVPNAAWPVLTGELLGIRDVRQLAVGSTGYVSDASGVRSKCVDQMPWTFAQGPFDLGVFAHGYNDAGRAADVITANALACYQLFRQKYPLTPIVVLGAQAGAGGPNATQIACENAIKAAVTLFDDPLCKFAPVSTDTQTWLNGTGKVGATNGSGNSDVYIDPDGVHPTLAGAEYLAFRSAPAIRAAIASMVL
jgi:lysophospholipase L1-like esterase